MKSFRRSLPFVLISSGFVFAQTSSPPPAPSVQSPESTGSPRAPVVMLTADELDTLLGPIALYPDALIALILPAAAAPTDIVLAARYLQDFPNDLSQVENRAWDESVKSLTHYPEVLKWMDENLPWTKQVGEAFIAQPAEVMQSIQRLRARARTAGTLIDTPQQQVLAEPNVIRIVPAQRDVIYVPRYEPDVVFINRPVHYTHPLLTFGVGVRVGSWLASDCDWRRHKVWMGNRHRSWRGHDWRRPLVHVAPGFTRSLPAGVRQWCPPVRTTHSQRVHHFRSSTQHRSHSSEIHRPSTVRTSPRVTLHSRNHVTPSNSRYKPPVYRPAVPPRATVPASNRPRTHSFVDRGSHSSDRGKYNVQRSNGPNVHRGHSRAITNRSHTASTGSARQTVTQPAVIHRSTGFASRRHSPATNTTSPATSRRDTRPPLSHDHQSTSHFRSDRSARTHTYQRPANTATTTSRTQPATTGPITNRHFHGRSHRGR